MDTFIEQIVQKKKGAKEFAVIFGCVLGVLLVLVVGFLFLGTIGLMLALLAGVGAFYAITAQNREYEYSVTNGYIDIDEIIGKRKRKRQVSVSGSKLECLLPYDPARGAKGTFQRTLVAAPSAAESGLWYFTYHSKKNGHTLVIIRPDERVLRAIYAGLQKLVSLDTDRALREQGLSLK